MKWNPGRQGSGYFKIKLFEYNWPVPFDCYILKFPEGSHIKSHRDPVTNGSHFRLNLVLLKAKKGGEFICENAIFNLNRIKLFRSDIHEHSVNKVISGTRYVLSIGWLLK